jgi:hypothetical protein
MKEEGMTKLGLLGAAAVVSFALAGPTMAQAETAKHVNPNHVQNVACDPRDPGNPFSRTYDYMTWSAWRRRGSWDDRADYTCQPIPVHPFGTGGF